MAKPNLPVSKPPEPKLDFPTSMVANPVTNAETIHSGGEPPESEYGPAVWRSLQDGFLYRHCVAPHPTGKTHKGLIPRTPDKELGDPGFHTGLFWEGSEEEWFANFRKE